MHRRQFVKSVTAFGAVSLLPQTSNAQDTAQSMWGGPVIDMHHHWRAPLAVNIAHMDGAGITRSLLLAEAQQEADATAAVPTNRFSRFISVVATRPDAIAVLRKARENGALGFGEMKSRVALDSPEMKRIYALAAEMNVPVLAHFQEVTQQLSVGTYNTGYARFPALLKEFPKTLFIGHADAFWANVSTEVPTDNAYPPGPVKRGGLTDRLLTDTPTLYGDLSATSGRNFLARDPEFARDFLIRHQDKLMFGSDCFCTDGKGAGQTNPLPILAGKCVARETLTALKSLTSPEVFRKIVWGNGTRLLKLG
ncbi:MAG: amidohydrolase [Acidobacteriota bacterium]